MPAVFEQHGLRFAYPENWRVEEAPIEEGWSATVQSPSHGTAFLTISVHANRPSVQSLLDATLAALREDYPELEAEDASEQIAGHHARGKDVQFFSLDLVNNCWIRCFRTSRETVLILCQSSDLESDYAEPVLRAMRASIEVIEA
jgi:hypothetical protein